MLSRFFQDCERPESAAALLLNNGITGKCGSSLPEQRNNREVRNLNIPIGLDREVRLMRSAEAAARTSQGTFWRIGSGSAAAATGKCGDSHAFRLNKSPSAYRGNMDAHDDPKARSLFRAFDREVLHVTWKCCIVLRRSGGWRHF